MIAEARMGDRQSANRASEMLLAWSRAELRRRGAPDAEDVIGWFAAMLARDDFRRIPDFGDDDLHFLRFLRKSLNRRLIDRSRERKVVPAILFSELMTDENDSYLDPADASSDPLRRLLRRELAREIAAALEFANEENRRMIMDLSEGSSHAELAEKNGMKANAARQRIHSIRRQVIERLSKK